MSDSAREKKPRLVNELRVSANLMTLDAGLFCIVCNPSKAANTTTGLPGVRVSLPPGSASRPDAVQIVTFRDDGWLVPFGDAALVRVSGGPAHILITVYQAPDAPEASAPNLQVLRLSEGDAASGAAPGPAARAPAAAALASALNAPAIPTPPLPPGSKVMDMVAHIQGMGDVGGMIGERLGEQGGGRWIEGFAVAPTTNVTMADIEYQAVLGRDWLSPWVEGGQFCGSRGMALPLLGFRLRLRGPAAEAFDCRYSASFVDGSTIGPVPAGEACQSEGLAALESLQIFIAPRRAGTRTPPAPAKPTVAKPPTQKPSTPTPAAPKPATPKPATPKSPTPKSGSAKPAAKPKRGATARR